MLISVKPCPNCKADKVSDFREYDGMLGYEAIICKKCGCTIDDKLNRIAKGEQTEKVPEDTELDLIGYLILSRVLRRLVE